LGRIFGERVHERGAAEPVNICLLNPSPEGRGRGGVDPGNTRTNLLH
jgi:hypothetical protein